jgi:chemotaxis protein MotB
MGATRVNRRAAPTRAAVLLCSIAACSISPEHDGPPAGSDPSSEVLKTRVEELEAQAKTQAETIELLEKALGDSAAADSSNERAKLVKAMVERFRADTDIKVEADSEGYRFVLSERVLFAAGDVDLTDAGRAALARVAEVLRTGSDRVRIEGHTDNVPVSAEGKKRFPRGNMELSAQRALTVWDFLVKAERLSESRFAIAGYGPHRPRTRNRTDLERHRNRRVELLVQLP